MHRALIESIRGRWSGIFTGSVVRSRRVGSPATTERIRAAQSSVHLGVMDSTTRRWLDDCVLLPPPERPGIAFPTGLWRTGLPRSSRCR